MNAESLLRSPRLLDFVQFHGNFGNFVETGLLLVNKY